MYRFRIPVFVLLTLSFFLVSTSDALADENTEHFEYEGTFSSMIVLVDEVTMGGEDLEVGDEIGIFTPEGTCAGGWRIEEEDIGEMVGMAAWPNDVDQEGQQGFMRAGDEITFRMWDESEDLEMEAEIVEIITGVAEFAQNGFFRLILNGVPPQEDEPDIELSEDAHDFGDVTVDETAEWVLEISNVGAALLTVSNIAVEGDGFSTDYEDGDIEIDVDGMHELTVTFSPGDEGDFEGTITITSDSPDEEEVTVDLTGAGAADMREGVYFRYVPTFNSMAILVMEGLLNGEGLVADDEIGVFTPGGVCAGAWVMENDEFPVGPPAFPDDPDIPGIEGFAANEDLFFRFYDASEDEEWEAEIVEIIGQGEAVFAQNGFVQLILAAGEIAEPPDIELSEDAHDFGDVTVDETAEWVLEISNVGGGVLTISDIAVGDGAFSTDYEGGEIAIDPDGMHELTVTFAPDAEEDFEGTITITSDSPDEEEVTVDLTGAGAADLREGVYFLYVPTFNSMAILVMEGLLNGEGLVADDEIGVFTPGGVCAGAWVMENDEFPVGPPAFPDDPDIPGIEGFAANEDLFFRFYDASEDQEWEAEIVEIIGQGEAVFAQNGFVQLILAAGEIAEPPDIELSEDAHDFGDVTVDETAEWVLEISNVGAGLLTVSNIEVAGDGFSIDYEGGDVEIEPEGTFEVAVTFTPDAEGEFNGTLTVSSDSPDEEVLEVALTGIGVLPPAPDIELSADTHEFGEVEIGVEPEWALEISNVGDALLTISNIEVAGDGFSIDYEGGDVEIEPEGTFEVTVTFAPDAAGEFIGTLTVSSDSPEEEVLEVALTGIGVLPPAPDIDLSADEHNFGNMQIENVGLDWVLEIGNVGDEVLVISDISVGDGAFSTDYEGGDVEVEPEGMFELTVTFDPPDVEDYEATLTITSNSPEEGEVTVALSGRGVDEREGEHFLYIPTFNSMVILVMNAWFNEQILVAGDEIGVFTPGGICAGVWVMENEELPVGLPAFPNDPDQNGIQGFEADEELSFRFYDQSEDEEIEVEIIEVIQGEPVFAQNGWVQVVLGIGDPPPVNEPPVWDEVPDPIEQDENSLVEFDVVGSDPNEDGLTITPGELPEGAEFTDNGGGSGSFAWQTDFDDEGDYTITLTLSDGEFNIPVDVEITINNVNREPVWDDVPPEPIVVDETDLIEFGVAGSDPDGDPVTITPGELPEGAVFTDNEDGTGSFEWQTDYEDAGDHTVTLTLSDGEFNIPVDVEITVNDVNREPVWDDVPPEPIVLDETDLIEFGVAGSDPDGDPVTITPGELPEGAVFTDNEDGTGSFEWQTDYEDAGDHTVTLTLSDGEFDIPVDIEITVNDVNREPVWDDVPPEPIVVDETDLIEFGVAGSDPDGDPVTITPGELPEGAVFTDNEDGTGSFEWQTDYEDEGDYTVTLTLSDEEFDIPVDISITINNVNRAPVVVNAIADVNIDEDADPRRVDVAENLNDVFDDPDGDDMTFRIVGDPPAGFNLQIENDVTLFFAADDDFNYNEGGLDVTIEASDGDLPGEDVFNVIINPIQDLPVWVEYPTERVDVYKTELIEFALVAEDVDGDDLEISILNRGGLPEEGPAVEDHGDGTATFSWQTTENDAGDYNPTFRVFDGEVGIGVEVLIRVIGLIHFIDFDETDASHSVVVENLTFEDEDVPSGWEIGVFTPGGILSGAEPWDAAEEGGVGIAAWGEDDDNGQFRAGQTMTFIAWDFEEDVEYSCEIINMRIGNLQWQDGGLTVLSLNASAAYTVEVTFRERWNIISINVIPPQEFWDEEGPDVVLMTNQLRLDEETHNILLMKNQRGRFYAPELPFINIPYWGQEEGFYVKMREAVVTTWSGTPIAFNEDIPIRGGAWSYIAYFPHYDLPMDSPDFYAIQSILDRVLLIKNTQGRFGAPQLPFSNMWPLTEGEGYHIKISPGDDVVLNYPELPEGVGPDGVINYGAPYSGHWTEPPTTGENMSVVVSLGDVELTEGDQIAAFNTSGMLVGVGEFTNGLCGLAVWADDETTDEIDGLQKEEAFRLRFWDANLEEEINLRITEIQTGNLVYEANGFAVVGAEAVPPAPTEYYLSRAYPNPFNAQTKVTYGMPEAGNVSIKVFDLAGRLVATLIDGQQIAGNHMTVWNGSNSASGIYLIKMQSADFSTTRKVMLMR